MDDRVVWMIRNGTGKYFYGKRGEKRWGSFKQGRIFHRKSDATSSIGQRTGDWELIPFILTEADPDTLSTPKSKVVEASPDLRRLLESKL